MVKRAQCQVEFNERGEFKHVQKKMKLGDDHGEEGPVILVFIAIRKLTTEISIVELILRRRCLITGRQ